MKTILYAGLALFTGLYTTWCLILSAGIAHGNWWPVLPAIGFPVALVLGLLSGTAYVLAEKRIRP